MNQQRVHVRPIVFAALVSMTFAAGAAACAESASPAPAPMDDGGPPDGARPDASIPDAAVDADARVPDEVDACSPAGWCATEVDERQSFTDLWPLEDSAVAIASREGRSAVVIYEGSTWRTIHQVPFVLASVWASPDDVWVAGDSGYVAHGHREGNEWTWNVRSLAVSSNVTAIWGAGPRDVYALADTRVWRLVLDADGEMPDDGWSVDYGDATGPDPELTLTSLVGRSADDIWVTGTRGSFSICGLVLHKTSAGWESAVDGVPVPFDPFEFVPPRCDASGSTPMLGSPIGKGTATGPGELVVITDVGSGAEASFARVRHGFGGAPELTLVPRKPDVTSIWGASADDLWITSFSVVERGRAIWDDGGWEISSVAFDGIAIAKAFHVVRGTRNDNLWLAGESHVFHKTNP